MPPGAAKKFKKERKKTWIFHLQDFLRFSLIVSISPPKFSFCIHFLEDIKHSFSQPHDFGFPVGMFPLLLNSLSLCFFVFVLVPLFCLLVHRLF